MVYAISDTHFQNENIIRYCERPFADAHAQTEELIRRWNEVVEPTDCVIHCGDFIMGKADGVREILPRLNGNIVLVRGNHDTAAKLEIYRNEFQHKVAAIKEVHYVDYKGIAFVFCHFPLVNGEFGKMVAARHEQVVFVHGHVHNSTPFINDEHHAFNVSADVIDFAPVSLDTLARTARQRWKGR